MQNRQVNKMKLIIISLLLTFSIITAQTEEPDPFDFFPSAVGNYWEYEPDKPQYNYTVLRDSIGEDGSKYLFFFDPPLYYGANYRIDTNGNVYRAPQFSYYLEYKLSADSGDTWMVQDLGEGNITKARVEGTFKTIIFGEIVDAKRIGYYELYEGDTTITETSLRFLTNVIARGFGLIWSYAEGATWPTQLQGCIINGKKYGTVVSVEEIEEITFDISLNQNYPNPINPTTNIEYTLNYPGKVNLKVYDVLGREVTTLVNEFQSTGIYQVQFSVKDNQLTSGIYLYRLTINNTTRTKKMIYAK